MDKATKKAIGEAYIRRRLKRNLQRLGISEKAFAVYNDSGYEVRIRGRREFEICFRTEFVCRCETIDEVSGFFEDVADSPCQPW